MISYARALELLINDYQHEPLRRISRPLLEWVAQIGHPEKESLLAFDYATECGVKREEEVSLKEEASRQREKEAERMRWYREDKKWIEWYKKARIVQPGDSGERDESFKESRTIYPGGWVIVALDDGFIPADLMPNPSICDLCHKAETKQFWFNLTSNVLRCDLCQALEWIARGYEVDDRGLAIWSHAPDELGPRGGLNRKRHSARQNSLPKKRYIVACLARGKKLRVRVQSLPDSRYKA